MAPVIAGYWERAEFPHKLVPSFADLGLAGGNIKGYGCPVRPASHTVLCCVHALAKTLVQLPPLNKVSC